MTDNFKLKVRLHVNFPYFILSYSFELKPYTDFDLNDFDAISGSRGF